MEYASFELVSLILWNRLCSSFVICESFLDQHCNVSDIPVVHTVLKMGQEVFGKQPWPPGKLVLLILALCLLISAAGAPVVPSGDGPSALLSFSHLLSESCGGRAVWELQAFTTATLVSWRKARVCTQPKNLFHGSERIKRALGDVVLASWNNRVC